MNGRVYDYNLGRFMSVDPVIQSPGNSQSINPYSYIMNNPLAGTDPTGYVSEKETVEVTKDTEAFKDGDGNMYVGAGDGSGDLIKVESVTVTKSNGSSTTTNYGAGGAITGGSLTTKGGTTFSVSDIGGQAEISVSFNSGQSGGSGGGATNGDSSLTAANNSLVGQSNGQLSKEEQFYVNVILPTLKHLGVTDKNVAVLLLATAIHESDNFLHRKQFPTGPARSYFQIEKNTHDDNWNSWLSWDKKMAKKFTALMRTNNKYHELEFNDSYATAHAYLKYYRAGVRRAGVPFPSGTNIQAMAEYWADYYNAGANRQQKINKFMKDWDRGTN